MKKKEIFKLPNCINRNEGSVTLFVLISIVFFIIILVGLYANTQSKLQAEAKNIEKIQQAYQLTDEQIDNKYFSIVGQEQ